MLVLTLMSAKLWRVSHLSSWLYTRHSHPRFSWKTKCQGCQEWNHILFTRTFCVVFVTPATCIYDKTTKEKFYIHILIYKSREAVCASKFWSAAVTSIWKYLHLYCVFILAIDYFFDNYNHFGFWSEPHLFPTLWFNIHFCVQKLKSESDRKVYGYVYG